MECLFCKIATGDIPARKLYEDDLAIALHDTNPQAPVHFLVIPKKHIATLHDLDEQTDKPLVGHLVHTAQQLALQLGCDKGFRVVINCDALAGQTVFHLHLHVLGQRPLYWPPG